MYRLTEFKPEYCPSAEHKKNMRHECKVIRSNRLGK